MHGGSLAWFFGLIFICMTNANDAWFSLVCKPPTYRHSEGVGFEACLRIVVVERMDAWMHLFSIFGPSLAQVWFDCAQVV